MIRELGILLERIARVEHMALSGEGDKRQQNSGACFRSYWGDY